MVNVFRAHAKKGLLLSAFAVFFFILSVQSASAAMPDAGRWYYPLGADYPFDPYIAHTDLLPSGKYHAGDDIGAPAGTPVYAMARGRVLMVQVMDRFGLVIIIGHRLPNGKEVVSLYGHLWPGKSLVKRGDIVKGGQQIGVLGTRENNGGWRPHIHCGVSTYVTPNPAIDWQYYGHVNPELLDIWVDTVKFLAKRGARYPTGQTHLPRHALTLRRTKGKRTLRLLNESGRKHSNLKLSTSTEKGLRDIVVHDVTGNGIPNIVATRNKKKRTTVAIFTRKGKFINEFTAFKKPVKDGARIAVGDVDGDEHPEIVVGSGKGLTERVVILETSGEKQAVIYPFAKKDSRKGIDVAVGDVNGDGIEEVIATKREGGRSVVSVAKNTGDVLDVFRVFSSKHLHGLNVTAGDVDGDDLAEIVLADRQRVVVYEQKKKSPHRFDKRSSIQYRPFQTNERNLPIDVSLVDWENDGKMEIQMAVGGEAGEARLKTVRFGKKKRVLLDRLLPVQRDFAQIRLASWKPKQE